MGFTVAEILGVDTLASTEPAVTYTPTIHLARQLRIKGITLSQVKTVLAHPGVVTRARGDGNQRRFTARGLAVIVDDNKKAIVTVYPDQRVNPLRQDQRADSRAMRWAHQNGVAA